MDRRLDAMQIGVRPGSAVSVILASHGYPGSYSTGHKIVVDELSPSMPLTPYLLHVFPDCCDIKDVVVFHAGTKSADNDTVTSGGRVLAITAYGPTLQEALNSAYAGVEKVSFKGKTFRRDIGRR